MDQNEIGIFDTKTLFSEVVDRVQREGRSITITRRGKPVAQITPCTGKGHSDGMTKAEAIEALKKLRKRVKPMDRDEIVDLLHEGREL